jgi:cytochrome o ubiquinol oxidase subunit III
MLNSIAIEAEEHEAYVRTIFGFWLYLMTDCVVFATLFATYLVLHNNTFGGPTSNELFHLPSALTETIILLLSSFTCGLGLLAARRYHTHQVLAFFGLTFILGLSFLSLEIREFTHLIQEGNSWQKSAFLSAYFTLVGTHGLHIAAGLLWILVMMRHILVHGLILPNLKRLMCLSLFWHFLDLVWIFIFTVVYLMGAI